MKIFISVTSLFFIASVTAIPYGKILSVILFVIPVYLLHLVLN